MILNEQIFESGSYSYDFTGLHTQGHQIIFRTWQLNGSNSIFYLDNVKLIESDDKDLTILEENNYYPFGLKHKGYNNVINGTDHNYGFGGKEEQDELGLGWIDVTARNYDPALGRWMNLDPLAELMRRHSPYNYAFDNPIFFTDPDGMSPEAAIDPIQRDKNGKIIYASSGNIQNFEQVDTKKSVDFEIGYIFADDGTPIKVLKNNQGGKKCWDTNCHGTTFADGEFWIDNDSVDDLITGDGYENITDLKEIKIGDKVTYSNGGETEHSVTISATDGTVEGIDVEGLGGLETEKKTTNILKAWHSADKLDVLHKKQPDKIVDDKDIPKLIESIPKI